MKVMEFLSEKKEIVFSALILILIYVAYRYGGLNNLQALKQIILFLPVIYFFREKNINKYLLMAWIICFSADIAVRIYIYEKYAAHPNSSMVLTSIVNTNYIEIREYFESNLRDILYGVMLFFLMVKFIWFVSKRSAFRSISGKKIIFYPVILIVVIAYMSSPWRRMHPIFYWSDVRAKINSAKIDIGNSDAINKKYIKSAVDSNVKQIKYKNATIVVVITESINRDNLSLYGYARDTTPYMRSVYEKENLFFSRYSWSVEASTVPALASVLRPSSQCIDSSCADQDVLALAKLAGYKTFWISNHDDLFIKARHGDMADQKIYINNSPGRSGASLDEGLLPHLNAALDDSASLKLIFVHMMGAHPHYSYRYPDGYQKFSDDIISTEMNKSGMDYFIRELRNYYDTAIRYHDFVLKETLEAVKKSSAENKFWIMISDHGQEVGHEKNISGHSPATAAGYKIPFLIWTNSDNKFNDDIYANKPMRGDWFIYTAMPIFGIYWDGYNDARNIFSSNYIWVEPNLKIEKIDYMK